MPPAGTKLSIERDVFPALVGRRAVRLRGQRLLARHRDARALPAGDLRHPRRRGQDRGRPRGSRAPVADARSTATHAVAGSVRRAGARRSRLRRSRPTRLVGGRTRARSGRDRRRGRPRRTRRCCSTGCSVGRGTTAQRVDRRPGRDDRRALPDRRRRRARRGRHRRGGQHASRRRRVSSPGVELPDGSDRVLTRDHRLEPRGDRRSSTRAGSSNDILGLPEHLRDALWRVESANLEPAGLAGRAGRRRDGRLRRSAALLARAALGDRASRPIVMRARLRAAAVDDARHDRAVRSYSGDTEETLAAYEAAGALGARRIVARPAAQLARGRTRRRRAGDPAPGRLPAARGGRATRSWSRSRWRRCAAPASRCTPRSTSPPPTPKQLVADWGPDARRGLAREAAGARRCTARSRRSSAPG